MSTCHRVRDSDRLRQAVGEHMKDHLIERQGGERPPSLTFGRVTKCGLILATLTMVTWPVVAQVMDARRAGDMVKLQRLTAAMEMYIADRSDWMPIFFENIAGGVCLPNAPTICGQKQMWQFAVYPYHNDWSIMTAPKEKEFPDPAKQAFNVSYGYNYSQLSVLCIANDGGFSQSNGCTFTDPGSPNSTQWYRSSPASHIDKPERTILIADSGGKDLTTATLLGSMLNPPDAWTATYYSYGPIEIGWGVGCKNYFAKTGSGGQAVTGKWQNTDGFAARYSGGANVALADGHVEWLTPAQVAEGTNWTPTIKCTSVQMTDPELYRWNPHYLGLNRP